MKKRNVIGLILLVIYLCAVAWCCFGHLEHMPKAPKSLMGIPMDKVGHFIMFLPFPFLFYSSFGFIPKKRWQSFVTAFVTFLAGLLVAAGTEIGQSFTSYRGADPKDFMSDALALAFSSVIIIIRIACSRKR